MPLIDGIYASFGYPSLFGVSVRSQHLCFHGYHLWIRHRVSEAKRLRFTAFLTFDQRDADRFNISLAGLVTTDQITNILAVIGELSGCDSRH